jgi:N-methylhydantoinase A
MRYRGQGYEIEVELPSELPAQEALEQLPELFARRYEQVFSMSFIEQPLEIVNWKVEAAGPQPLAATQEFRLAARPGKDAQSAQKGSREAYFPELDGYLECPVYDRHALQAGQLIEGPALIEERESTLVLGIGDRGRVDVHGNTIGQPASSPKGAG